MADGGIMYSNTYHILDTEQGGGMMQEEEEEEEVGEEERRSRLNPAINLRWKLKYFTVFCKMILFLVCPFFRGEKFPFL